MKRVTTYLLLALTLVAALALAGCGQASKPKPEVAGTVTMKGSTAHLDIQLKNFEMGGKDGHVHLYLDQIATPVTLLRPMYDLPNVKPGKHQFRLELSDPQHNPIGIETVVPFEAP